MAPRQASKKASRPRRKAGRRGRPSIYSEALAERLFEELAAGRSLRSICAQDDMPETATIFRWLPVIEGFRDRYALARQAGLDAMAEEAVSIADDGLNDTYLDGDGNRRTDFDVVQRSKLRVDTRKWFLSKMAPGRYGDKQDISISGSITTMSQEQLDARLAELLRKAGIGEASVRELPAPSEE